MFDSGSAQSTVTLDFSLAEVNTFPVDVFVILRYDPVSQNGFVVKATTAGLYLYQLSSGSLSQVDYSAVTLYVNTTYTLTVQNTSGGVSASVGETNVSYSSETGNTETIIALGFRSWSDDDCDAWIDNLLVTS
jgi:hypothetical protein